LRDTYQDSKQLLLVIDPQVTVLLEFELARVDLGFSLFEDKPEMQSADGSETVAKVRRDCVAFLSHRWVNEPSLLEHFRLLKLFRGHFAVLSMKLELLPLNPRGQVGSDAFEEHFTNVRKTKQEGPSRLVPHTPVQAHVEVNIKVHTLEWHVAFDELDVGISHSLGEGVVVHDGADSPDDFPLVSSVWDVADLDFHEVEKERERSKKCGRYR